MKESCLILLQTIPGSIDIEVFKTDLLKTFDEIVSVHDLHIWQMTSSKYVSTVHILFHDPIVSSVIKFDKLIFLSKHDTVDSTRAARVYYLIKHIQNMCSLLLQKWARDADNVKQKHFALSLWYPIHISTRLKLNLMCILSRPLSIYQYFLYQSR